MLWVEYGIRLYQFLIIGLWLLLFTIKDINTELLYEKIDNLTCQYYGHTELLYSKFDVNLSDCLQVIKPNQWTVKYRSL